MTVRKTKPDKVTVVAGATVEVQFGEDTLRFHCSGSNEGRELTPADVIRNLKDCIQEASKGKPKRRKK